MKRRKMIQGFPGSRLIQSSHLSEEEASLLGNSDGTAWQDVEELRRVASLPSSMFVQRGEEQERRSLALQAARGVSSPAIAQYLARGEQDSSDKALPSAEKPKELAPAPEKK